MHETSSPYHVGAGRNHHFSSETFSANGVVTPYTLFWHIGSCIMLSPIRTCPRVGVRPILPEVVLPRLLNLAAVIRNTHVLLIRFSFCYIGWRRAFWLNHSFLVSRTTPYCVFS
jgi:hypothetical protein